MISIMKHCGQIHRSNWSLQFAGQFKELFKIIPRFCLIVQITIIVFIHEEESHKIEDKSGLQDNQK